MEEFQESFILLNQDQFRNLAFSFNNHSGDDQSISKGVAVLLIFVVMYLFGFIYLIYTRFLSGIIEDLVYLSEEKGGQQWTLFVYCFLNSLGVLIYNILSMFVSETDIGVTVTFGTDIYALCFLYAIISINIIQKKKKFKEEGRQLDAWFFLRDSLIYLVVIIAITFFYYLDDITWWMALCLFVYTIVFFSIIAKNESIKNKIYRLIGLTHEDDSFNAEELTKQKKRAVALEYLLDHKLINKEATDLKKKIAKNEGLIIMKYGKEDPKTKILMNFHRAVYTIMFAIRNKHKMEKKQRSRYYANLWKKEDNEMDEDDDDYLDDDQSEDPQNNFISNPSIQNYTDQPVLDKINIMQKQTEQEKIEDKTSLRDNLNQNGENQSEQQMINNEEITDNKQNLANSDDENENQQEDEDDDEDEDDEEAIPVTLQFPPDTISRISYILFFPFHLILFLLPNYHINPSLLKLFKCLICNIIFLGLTLFLIEWWVNEIAKSLGFNIEIIGFLFVSFGLSFPFMIYNYKIGHKEEQNVEFFQSYLQLGIFKQSFVLSVTWLLSCIVNLQANVKQKKDENLKYVLTSYSSLMVFLFFFQLINSCKINKAQSYTLLVIFVIFALLTFILLLTDF